MEASHTWCLPSLGRWRYQLRAAAPAIEGGEEEAAAAAREALRAEKAAKAKAKAEAKKAEAAQAAAKAAENIPIILRQSVQTV